MEKEIHKALIENGFKKDGKYYRKDGGSIKIQNNSTLDSIFKQLINFGQEQRMWAIQRVIGL